MLGTVKAACTFIPLDTKYTTNRINQIFEDSADQYTITTADRATSENFIDVKTLLNYENTDRSQVEILPNDLAYLIYTSGSKSQESPADSVVCQSTEQLE